MQQLHVDELGEHSEQPRPSVHNARRSAFPPFEALRCGGPTHECLTDHAAGSPGPASTNGIMHAASYQNLLGGAATTDSLHFAVEPAAAADSTAGIMDPAAYQGMMGDAARGDTQVRKKPKFAALSLSPRGSSARLHLLRQTERGQVSRLRFRLRRVCPRSVGSAYV